MDADEKYVNCDVLAICPIEVGYKGNPIGVVPIGERGCITRTSLSGHYIVNFPSLPEDVLMSADGMGKLIKVVES